MEFRKLITRRLAVQVGTAWNKGLGVFFKNRYNTGFDNILIHYDGKKTDYFVNKEEFNKFNKDLDNHLDDPEFVKNLVPEAQIFLEDSLLRIGHKIKKAKSLPNKDLSQAFKDISYHHGLFYSRMWMIFRICERIVKKITTKLGYFPDIFATPLIPNDVMNERIDLLNMKIKGEDNLEQHTKKYQHIPLFDYDHTPYDINHFREQYTLILNPEKELKKIQDVIQERKQLHKKALSKINDQRTRNLIEMLKLAVVLRDHRDMIRQKKNLALREFYNEIGSRIDLTIEETALLMDEEIVNHLNRNKKFNKKEIEKRQSSFLLKYNNNTHELYAAKSAQNLVKSLNLYQDNNITNLKGIGASPGIVQGKVKIIYTNKDLHKIKKGDILITSMTRQDFVPYLRLAGGIITNEGGLTCHAAIIARELNIPCIVGMKNATDIIEDNTEIQMNGKTGKITT